MQTADFNFDLPDELIARYPTQQRTGSRLLHVNAEGQIAHRQFSDVIDLLRAGDLLVVNNTQASVPVTSSTETMRLAVNEWRFIKGVWVGMDTSIYYYFASYSIKK